MGPTAQDPLVTRVHYRVGPWCHLLLTSHVPSSSPEVAYMWVLATCPSFSSVHHDLVLLGSNEMSATRVYEFLG